MQEILSKSSVAMETYDVNAVFRPFKTACKESKILKWFFFKQIKGMHKTCLTLSGKQGNVYHFGWVDQRA